MEHSNIHVCEVCRDIKVNRDKYLDFKEMRQYFGGSDDDLYGLLYDNDLGYNVDGHIYARKCEILKMGVHEASEYLGLDRETLLNYVNTNKIPHCYYDGSLFFFKEKLDGWVDYQKAMKGIKKRHAPFSSSPLSCVAPPELDSEAQADHERRKQEVLQLREAGLSNYDIAKQFGVSEGAVRKWLKWEKD